MHDYRAVLRRLALRDDTYISGLLSEGCTPARASTLDPTAHVFVQLGALIATAAPSTAFMPVTEEALAIGATREEIVGSLIDLLPVVGVTRVVAAAPNLALALGYDVFEALEQLDDGGPSSS